MGRPFFSNEAHYRDQYGGYLDLNIRKTFEEMSNHGMERRRRKRGDWHDEKGVSVPGLNDYTKKVGKRLRLGPDPRLDAHDG